MKQPHRVTWAKRPIEGTEEHAYAAGIIDGLGHAILMQTTALEYGPGTFSYNLYARSKEAINEVVQFPAKPSEADDDFFDETGEAFEESPLSDTAGERNLTPLSPQYSPIPGNGQRVCIRGPFASFLVCNRDERNELGTWLRRRRDEAVKDALAAEDFFDYVADEANPFSTECIAELVPRLYLDKSRLLIAAQGSKDWFYLRVGRLTSTTTYSALRALAIALPASHPGFTEDPLSSLSSAIEEEVF